MQAWIGGGGGVTGVVFYAFSQLVLKGSLEMVTHGNGQTSIFEALWKRLSISNMGGLSCLTIPKISQKYLSDHFSGPSLKV